MNLLQARVSGLATAIGLLLVACTSADPARPASDAAPTAAATASASSTGSPSGGPTTDCDSVATCYTPQQLQVAYGIKPLLDRGIDGRGETVVLPELAESRVNPPWVTDMRQDMAAFDSLYHLPAARMRVDDRRLPDRARLGPGHRLGRPRSVVETGAVIRLAEPPQLVWPTVDVRVSYLVGEQADCMLRGTPTQWLEAASDDFAGFVAARRGVQIRWGVPSTVFWYVSGEYYLGTLVVRHQLTPELAETGGHIGYHVVAPWRRQGHATRMLAAGLEQCRGLGLDRVLVTCAIDNEPSRRVILANGGVPDGQRDGEDRFWISLGPDRHS